MARLLLILFAFYSCYLLVSCHVSLEFGDCCYFVFVVPTSLMAYILSLQNIREKTANNTTAMSIRNMVDRTNSESLVSVLHGANDVEYMEQCTHEPSSYSSLLLPSESMCRENIMLLDKMHNWSLHSQAHVDSNHHPYTSSSDTHTLTNM